MGEYEDMATTSTDSAYPGRTRRQHPVPVFPSSTEDQGGRSTARGKRRVRKPKEYAAYAVSK